MQTVSGTYYQILEDPNHYFETQVVIGNLTLGESQIYSLKRPTTGIFPGSTPELGKCISSEIDLKIIAQSANIPKMAQIIPYVRIRNASSYSEWIQKGEYFIDTREDTYDGGKETVTIHGYDAMLKTEVDFPIGRIAEWPATDINVVNVIAQQIGVGVDSRVASIMNKSYQIQLPTGYTSREVLGYIGAMYAGCWLINDVGLLQLICLNGLPEATNYLIDNIGNAITFGGDRILV